MMIARQHRSVLAGGVDAGGAIVLGAVAAAAVVAGIGDVGEAIHQRAQSVMRRWCAREEWRVVSRTGRERTRRTTADDDDDGYAISRGEL